MLAFAMPEATDRLTREQVEAVAALANLQLDAAEVELFGRQLGDVLSYAAELQEIDTTGVPPTFGVSGRGADRPDQVVPSLPPADVFANAPESDRSSAASQGGGFFKVPRVIG
jgi:aspartyl-tRNA(Asn)/glutamyl-tRNA(Gln) amidotransferase subunit C